MNRLLKKWTYLSVVAAAVVIGCGGSGGHKGSTGGTGTNGGTPGTNLAFTSNTAVFNPKYGRINVTFLTGQGRATGDLTAVITRLTFEDQFGVVTKPLDTATNAPLAGFVSALKYINIPMLNQPSRLFESYSLDIPQFLQETDSGSTAPIDPPAALPKSFAARIRVMPGRDTGVPIYLDDSMFYFSTDPDSGVSTFVFDENQFTSKNYNNGAIRSFFSDYVSFDIRNLPDDKKPVLSDTTQTVDRVFLSGDNYALGVDSDITAPGTRRFEVLTTEVSEPIVGRFTPESTVGTYHPGTYSLTQVNPTIPDLPTTAQIISIQGQIHEFKTILTGFSTFEMITFPHITDDSVQEMVMLKLDGSKNLVDMYYGYVDLDSKTFSAFPIKNLPDASGDKELDGTVTNFTTAGGSTTSSPDLIRRGTFTFNDSAAATAAGLNPTGTFFVFRK